jgi:adenine-specific DNA methylase
MLIATATLIITLLGGNVPDGFFTLPEIKKEIKVQVTDKEKQKEILAIMKETNKKITSFNKKLNKSIKSDNLYRSRDVTLEQLTTYHENLINERNILQKEVIAARMKVINLMTEEEWNAVNNSRRIE